MRLKDIDIDGSFPLTVSECGNVVINRWSTRHLKPRADRVGYMRVWAAGPFRKRRGFSVHRLVALAWLDCPDNYAELDVNHKDGNKANNHYSNLEWVTHRENMLHAKANGLWVHRKFGPRERTPESKTWGRPKGSKNKKK